VVVLAGLAVVFNLGHWWAGAPPDWRGCIASVGIGLLGLAFVVGHQRRRPFNALIGVSLALGALYLGLEIAGR
jgi:MYXO-CTERM domain-containing protein